MSVASVKQPPAKTTAAIMVTSDYSKFKFIDGNRPLEVGENLRDSIRKNGFFNSKPIVVNQHMEILDGQNRFMLCQELSIPFSYMIENTRDRNHDYELIIAINKNQKNWRLDHYINLFAYKGVKPYVTIKDFINHYQLGVANSVKICVIDQANRTGKMRKGADLRINPHRAKIAEFINSCDKLHFYKTSNFVAAIVILFNKAKDDQIKRLHKKHMTIVQQPSALNYTNVFANIINKGHSDKIAF